MHTTRNTSQCCLRNHSVANAAFALPSITVMQFQDILNLLHGVHERLDLVSNDHNGDSNAANKVLCPLTDEATPRPLKHMLTTLCAPKTTPSNQSNNAS